MYIIYSIQKLLDACTTRPKLVTCVCASCLEIVRYRQRYLVETWPNTQRITGKGKRRIAKLCIWRNSVKTYNILIIKRATIHIHTLVAGNLVDFAGLCRAIGHNLKIRIISFIVWYYLFYSLIFFFFCVNVGAVGIMILLVFSLNFQIWTFMIS